MVQVATAHARSSLIIIAALGISLLVGVLSLEQPPSQSSMDVSECGPSDSLPSGNIRVRDLVGDFDIVMHVTADVQRDSVLKGRIALKEWSPADSGLRSPIVDWLVWGWTTISVDRIGDVPVNVPLSSDDPMRPGVLGAWDHQRKTITLFFGGMSPDGTVTFDAGVLVQVRATDEYGFRGTWGAGSIGPAPSGYFCAWRHFEGGDSNGRGSRDTLTGR